MLDVPIVDAHVHLWDPQHLTYAWLDEVPQINRPFLPADYRAAHGSFDVQRMVFVQCEAEQSRAEVEWVTGLACDESRIQAIVAHAAVERGAAAESDLEWLADQPLVKGVRRLIQTEPDLDFCLQPNFVAGVQLLAKFDLSFDLCVHHPQLANTIQLVKHCPDVRFVLDHMGKPDIKRQRFDPWREHIRQLSQLPNVVCKISGLVTEADTEHWQAADLVPYMAHVIDCFGCDRVMFGGDWPVVLMAAPLSRWIETWADQLKVYSPTERRKLCCDNAIKFYGLEPSPSGDDGHER